jgi:hypothetical protein
VGGLCWKNFHLGGPLEIAGVGFVGVHVNLEAEAGIDADDEIVEAGIAGGRSDFEGDAVEVFDGVKLCVAWGHVNMASGADEAFAHFEHPCGAHHVATWGSLDIAGHANGEIDTELDGVGEGEFDLGEVSAGAEDAEIGNDSTARTDESDGLFGGELPFLVEPLVDGEFGVWSEKGDEIFGGNVHVASGAIGHESWGGSGESGLA